MGLAEKKVTSPELGSTSRRWGTRSPGVPGQPQMYRALEVRLGEGQEPLKPELDLKVPRDEIPCTQQRIWLGVAMNE